MLQGLLRKFMGEQQPQQPIHTSDGTGFQRMPDGRALVNNKMIYPAGTQEDDESLPNMRPQQLRVGAPQPTQRMSVQQNRGQQPVGAQYEDEYTPSAALENTGYINPQTTQNGMFRQPGGYNPQTSVDGSLYNDLRRRMGL